MCFGKQKQHAVPLHEIDAINSLGWVRCGGGLRHMCVDGCCRGMCTACALLLQLAFPQTPALLPCRVQAAGLLLVLLAIHSTTPHIHPHTRAPLA